MHKLIQAEASVYHVLHSNTLGIHYAWMFLYTLSSFLSFLLLAGCGVSRVSDITEIIFSLRFACSINFEVF